METQLKENTQKPYKKDVAAFLFCTKPDGFTKFINDAEARLVYYKHISTHKVGAYRIPGVGVLIYRTIEKAEEYIFHPDVSEEDVKRIRALIQEYEFVFALFKENNSDFKTPEPKIISNNQPV